jgi:predicted DsbA family dithiol-disulfide isomerase
MTLPCARFFFDFIDPLSYLVGREFAEIETPHETEVTWVPFELRPPPMRLTSMDDPSLTERWSRARSEATRLGISLAPPDLVPWTRKAHELALFAHESGVGDVVRIRIFETYLLEGGDIGRVDVLVELGRQAGLDVTETKAVLDVDRYEAAVVEARGGAEELGVSDTPTLVVEERRLRGFHNRTTLGTFLRA